MSTLKRFLLLEDDNDAYNCFITYGFSIDENGAVNLANRAPDDWWTTAVKKFT